MNDKHHKLGLSRLFFPLLFVVALSSSCANPNKSYEIDPREFQVLPVNIYYDEAYSMALKWDTAAYPSYIFTTFAMPDDNSNTLFISYGFRSRTDLATWLMIMFNTMDPNHPKITNGKYPTGSNRPLTQEIEIKDLPFDSLDTLAIAYQNGGSDFLRENKGIVSDSFVELQQENEGLATGPLVWVVAFLAGRNNGMYVTIDSLTGNVLDVKHIDN